MSSPQEDLYIFEQRRLSERICCFYPRPILLERIYDEALMSEIHNHKIRPNKKSLFRVTGRKILGRVGTFRHSKCIKLYFFLEKNMILCILKGISNKKI